MRSDYISPEILDHLLAALTAQNELAMRVSLATGLRIDDVLSIKTAAIQNTKNNRITIHEKKTGKSKRVYIPQNLLDDMFFNCGRYYVFEGRTDPKKHRTRQAVWKDLKRASEAFRIRDCLSISPHTARKVYAAEAFSKYGNTEKIKRLLNHENEAVTALYIMAEAITAKKLNGDKDARKRRAKNHSRGALPPEGEREGGEKEKTHLHRKN